MAIMYEVYCCEMSVKHKEQHQLRHISLYQTLYTMKISNADLMCVDIYIYISHKWGNIQLLLL